MFAHSQGLSYTNPHIVDRPPEISWRPTNRKEKITDLPPSLNVRLWRERASVGIAVHCQIRVVVPQGFRLTRGFQKGHIEFWKYTKDINSDPVNPISVSFISYACSVSYVFQKESYITSTVATVSQEGNPLEKIEKGWAVIAPWRLVSFSGIFSIVELTVVDFTQNRVIFALFFATKLTSHFWGFSV